MKSIKTIDEYLNTVDESFDDLMMDAYGEFTVPDLLAEFASDKENGVETRQWDLIPAAQYTGLLKRYMSAPSPAAARIPDETVSEWLKMVLKDTLALEYITELAGHSNHFPMDDVVDYFGEECGVTDYKTGSEYLESIGFYDWCKLPDGSDAWSDYGIEKIYKVLMELRDDAEPWEKLLTINRVLDIAHCRGDLASAFIEGGSRTCSKISGLRESRILRVCETAAPADGLEPPYSGIFVSKADLYQTYYDIDFLCGICGFDYDGALRDLAGDLLGFLEFGCEGVGYDIGMDAYIDTDNYAKTGDVASGKWAEETLSGMKKLMRKKDWAGFGAFRLSLRSALLGIKEYGSSAGSDYDEGDIPAGERVPDSENPLLTGKKGRTWNEAMKDALEKYISDNGLPMSVSFEEVRGENCLVVRSGEMDGRKLLAALNYEGNNGFCMVKTDYPVYGKESTAQFPQMLKTLCRELGKTAYTVKEVDGYSLMVDRGDLVVSWKDGGASRRETLSPTKTNGVFSTMDADGELDRAVFRLGGRRKEKTREFGYDDGDGDVDMFKVVYYDFYGVLDDLGLKERMQKA